MYYISYGRDVKMYTLRHCIKNIDYYVKNLSTDLERAKEKAIFYVTNVLGLEKGEVNLDENYLPAELQEIQRRNAEQIQAEIEQKQREEQERIAAREQEILGCIRDGIWPFGKYKHQQFSQAPNDYIIYWIGVDDGKEYDLITNTLANTLKATFPHLVFNKPIDAYFGKVGDRVDVEVTTMKKVFFETMYGWSAAVTMIDSEGHLFSYVGAGDVSGFVIGEKIKIKATIKEHSVYNDQKQTKLQRIKVL